MISGLEILKTRTYNSTDVRKTLFSVARTVPTYEIELCTVEMGGINYVNGEAYPSEVGRILVSSRAAALHKGAFRMPVRSFYLP